MNAALLISQEIQPSTTSANAVFIQNLIKALAHLDFAAIEQLVQTLDEGQGFVYSNKWEFWGGPQMADTLLCKLVN